MPDDTSSDQTYHIGGITFVVQPVYPSGQGEMILAILLKLMKSDTQDA